jgi:DNA-binding PadR family transcriptional regulator
MILQAAGSESATDLGDRRMEGIDPLEFLPLSATDFQLLLALTAGGLHGYAISKTVREASEGRVRIGLGSLYRILARLLNAGMVEECDPEDEASADETTRRRYRLTTLGVNVLRAEVSRLSDAVELARTSRLFVGRKV